MTTPVYSSLTKQIKNTETEQDKCYYLIYSIPLYFYGMIILYPNLLFRNFVNSTTFKLIQDNLDFFMLY